MLDYLIVGAGLAGIAFAETARAQNKSFLVFDPGLRSASSVAGGVYNPVILKRLKVVPHAKEQLEIVQRFYATLETELGIFVNHNQDIGRRFASVEEQNDWFTAADRPALSPFLDTRLATDAINGLSMPFALGNVLGTGFIDTAKLLTQYGDFLERQGLMKKAEFVYSELEIGEEAVRYNGIAARHIVFAEGFNLHQNPYFNPLPLDGTKGELLVIRAPGLKLESVVKGGVFIIPLGDALFKIGATYDRWDKTACTTESGKAELISALETMIDCPYEIVEHLAAVRPTVRDRKPMMGTHPAHPRLHLLNGLGTRGVMWGPYCAKLLFDSIENGNPVPGEYDLRRFMR